MNNAQKLRKLYKKTQNEIADVIDYPKPLYAAYELNRLELPKEKLTALSEYYHVPVTYFTEDKNRTNKNR